MKSFIANLVLISSLLIWLLGVDYAPILKVLGFPLLISAIILWSQWSNTAKRWIGGVYE